MEFGRRGLGDGRRWTRSGGDAEEEGMWGRVIVEVGSSTENPEWGREVGTWERIWVGGGEGERR